MVEITYFCAVVYPYNLSCNIAPLYPNASVSTLTDLETWLLQESVLEVSGKSAPNLSSLPHEDVGVILS